MSSIQSNFPSKVKQVICSYCDKTISKQNFKVCSETVHTGRHSREKWKGLSLTFSNKQKTVEEINDNSFSVVSFPVDPLSISC